MHLQGCSLQPEPYASWLRKDDVAFKSGHDAATSAL